MNTKFGRNSNYFDMEKEKLPRQFKRMMQLLTMRNLQGRRHAIVWDYSNGRTESSKELTDPEVLKIIHDLERGFSELDRTDKMRKKIISQGHEMGWEYPGGKIDIDRLNAWCVKFGYLHKALNKYAYAELPALVTQFEAVYNSFIESLN
jgi:hypothetical protein